MLRLDKNEMMACIIALKKAGKLSLWGDSALDKLLREMDMKPRLWVK